MIDDSAIAPSSTCSCDAHAPVWNDAGYDTEVGCRCLYMFLDEAERVVKVGLVLHPSRVERRRREVANDAKRRRPNLVCVAQASLHGVSHQTAEHLESVTRHWLVNAHRFEHAGSSMGSSCPPRCRTTGRPCWTKRSAPPAASGGHSSRLLAEVALSSVPVAIPPLELDHFEPGELPPLAVLRWRPDVPAPDRPPTQIGHLHRGALVEYVPADSTSASVAR